MHVPQDLPVYEQRFLKGLVFLGYSLTAPLASLPPWQPYARFAQLELTAAQRTHPPN
jgi:hypothetical protein